MDERLQAGRHHLLNGERALNTGYPDDSRAHFEAALLQFRGPDLRLGEAHALRGLGQVEMSTGNPQLAEQRLQDAITSYQAVRDLLQRLDPEGVSHELQRDAEEGEAAALVLFGELMVRVGRIEEARAALGLSKEIYGRLGDVPSAAGAFVAGARLAMHEGRYEHARDGFERARAIHEKSGNLVGQVGVLLALAELARIRRDPAAAEDLLGRARPLTQQARHPMLEGRVLASLGSLYLQQLRLDDAGGVYEEAVALARRAGDQEMEGFNLVGLGDVRSRTTGDGLDELLEGARILGSIEHRQGLATALLRVGEHALRARDAEVALAAAEGARRLYRRTDPVRGVGLAWRVIVKALAALKAWEGVLAAAIAREAVAGAQQPNAREVAAFYRQRAPEEWLEALKPLGAKGVAERAEHHVEQALSATLGALGIGPDALGTTTGALGIVDALAKRLPRPSEARPGIEMPAPPPDDEDEIAEGMLEEPPEEEASAYFQQQPPGPAALFIGTGNIVPQPTPDEEPTGEPAPEPPPEAVETQADVHTPVEVDTPAEVETVAVETPDEEVVTPRIDDGTPVDAPIPPEAEPEEPTGDRGPEPHEVDVEPIQELADELIEPLTEEVPGAPPVGEPVSAEMSPAAAEYEAFYDPPTGEVALGASEAAPEPTTDDEPLPDVPDELKKAPPPDDYASFYDSPDEEG